MHANELTTRVVSRVLTSVMLVLALATAYVHLTLGGTIFLLNAIGYFVLAAGIAATAMPVPLFRRLRWLPRLGLAGFALLTIGAYLVIGPYSLLGLSIKAIEVALIGLVAADLINWYGSASRLERRPRIGPADRTVGQPAGG
jgi:hypothetical protein